MGKSSSFPHCKGIEENGHIRGGFSDGLPAPGAFEKEKSPQRKNIYGDLQNLLQYSHKRGLQIPMEIDKPFKGRSTYENSVSAYD
ncbi:hypothetical protein P5673_019853 [Acropora cervicornis]|uniref:Uncharacterized protein n=1 Tax=Acropora cervicornis TaxID=6130 RepID=A0AAD9QAS5_ACRCE|nr:hypothetical protein P5673_019853 [Acropora cervicornis]